MKIETTQATHQMYLRRTECKNVEKDNTNYTKSNLKGKFVRQYEEIGLTGEVKVTKMKIYASTSVFYIWKNANWCWSVVE